MPLQVATTNISREDPRALPMIAVDGYNYALNFSYIEIVTRLN